MGYIAPTVGRNRLWYGGSHAPTFPMTSIKWAQELSKSLEVGLSDRDERSGRIKANELGLKENDRFVCLHVRETGFYGLTEGIGKSTRNGSIENFIPATLYLIETGYKIFRLGDSTMTPLPPMEGVVDYPFSRLKCDLLDVWAIKNCELFIAHDSGPLEVVNLFEKPIVIPNIVEFCIGYPLRKGDLGILKHVYSARLGRYLSVKELVEMYLWSDTDVVGSDDLTFVENSPLEILALVQELVEQSSTINSDEEASPLQTAVLERRRNIEQSILSTSKLDSTEAPRMEARLLGCSGLLSRKYLEQNYHNNSLNN